MKTICFSLLFAAVSLLSAQSAVLEPSRTGYTGTDAAGPDVLGYWKFDGADPGKDRSGKGMDLKLRKFGKFTEQGISGSSLSLAVPWNSAELKTREDKNGKVRVHNGCMQPAGAALASYGKNRLLNPKEAFTLEAWILPDTSFLTGKSAFPAVIVDKKYYSAGQNKQPSWNTGYKFYLQKAGSKLFLTLDLGFTKNSEAVSSLPMTAKTGEWIHAAVTYDGKKSVRFYWNGNSAGVRALKTGGPVSPSNQVFTIGDRIGSYYNPFPGKIDEVRVTAREIRFYSGNLSLQMIPGPRVFPRFSRLSKVTVQVRNSFSQNAEKLTLTMTAGKQVIKTPVFSLRPEETREFTLPFKAEMKPGEYTFRFIVSGQAGKKKAEAVLSEKITIVPRKAPFMPVMLWGSAGPEELEKFGFTHSLIWGGTSGINEWKNHDSQDLSRTGAGISRFAEMDRHLKAGKTVGFTANACRFFDKNGQELKYRRVGRDGKPVGKQANAAHPDLQKFGYDYCRTIARSFSRHPAFEYAMINSEVRDGSQISFHDYDEARAKKDLGFPIPSAAVRKTGIPYFSIPGFPVSRIIPENDRLLRFYSWFWKTGDGWNDFHTRCVEGIQSEDKRIWTYYDPAVRVPSVWGSGGKVNVIEQWTYSYPDPLKVGQATDELFAMAAGQPGQQVMKMTQIIWYRNQTAPKPPADRAQWTEWEKRLDPPEKNRFITIAPDHLSIALWSMISRPVKGIMYHGWGSLTQSRYGGYRFSNGETGIRLKKLTDTVVRPLGPTLLKVEDAPAEVALLESFSSQMYAQRGSWGWSGSWEADMHLILQWAGFQPKIVYDETIRRDGLKGIKVLVMPCCDVLTEKVASGIRSFQKRGGIVVADEYLAPGILPDLCIPAQHRTRKPEQDKKNLQKIALELKKRLSPWYQPEIRTSSPDLVPRIRRSGSTDYLFLTNDRRTFGTYLGQHGLVMEKGLPLTGEVTLGKAGYLYDAVRHRFLGKKDRFPVSLSGGEGTLIVVSRTPVDALKLNVPARVRRDKAFIIAAEVNPAFDGVVPMKVTILDPAGKEAEFSGYYAAEKGKLAVMFTPASNDAAGTWRITAEELLSGKKQTTSYILE